MTFDQALVEKAKEAKSVEELLALAKDTGIELTAEEAEAYYAQLHADGELADDELENVSGGGCGKKKIDEYYYKTGDFVYFDVGDGVTRLGWIKWKNYVNSPDGGSVVYLIYDGKNRDGSDGAEYVVTLSQIKSLQGRSNKYGYMEYYD